MGHRLLWLVLVVCASGTVAAFVIVAWFLAQPAVVK